jgi:hypothetical protein
MLGLDIFSLIVYILYKFSEFADVVFKFCFRVIVCLGAVVGGRA